MASSLPKLPKKRLVLCSDGTWQSSNNGSRSIPSNVANLSRAIECWDKEAGIPQIVYYDTGIGTNLTSTKNTDYATQKEIDMAAKFEGGTGAGLAENVCEAYNFVVNNYSPGDEIYVFGFSRGAYTARAIAGLLAEVGVCDNSMMDQFWEMYAAYKTKKPYEQMKDTSWGKSEVVDSTYRVSDGQYFLQTGRGKQWLEHCTQAHIEVVGVFDTVGALGLPENVVTNVFDNNLEHGFHNTDIHPQIRNAFHAMAIDEHRRPFTPTLWYKPQENTTTNLIQCWFPGVHINIGGGSDDGLKELTEQVGDLEGMANITFAWMIDRVRQFTKLKFNDEMLKYVVARYMDNMAAVLERQIKANVEATTSTSGVYAALKSVFVAKKPAQIQFRGWGVGPISDSFTTSDLAMQKVGGSRVRAPGRYLFRKDKTDKAPAVQKQTNEFIHPVVDHAWSDPKPADALYKATSKDDWLAGALFGFSRERQSSGKTGYKYVQKASVSENQGYIEKSLTTSTSGAEWTSSNYPTWRGPVELPEFQIPPDGNGFTSMERQMIVTSPRDQVAVTWTGQARLEALQKANKQAYDDMMKSMEDQNKRAVQSLQKWDEQNGFAPSHQL